VQTASKTLPGVLLLQIPPPQPQKGEKGEQVKVMCGACPGGKCPPIGGMMGAGRGGMIGRGGCPGGKCPPKGAALKGPRRGRGDDSYDDYSYDDVNPLGALLNPRLLIIIAIIYFFGPTLMDMLGGGGIELGGCSLSPFLILIMLAAMFFLYQMGIIMIPIPFCIG